MNSRTVRTRRIAAVLATLSLAVGACGGSTAGDDVTGGSVSTNGSGAVEVDAPTAAGDTTSPAAAATPEPTPTATTQPSPTPTPTPTPTPEPRVLPTGIIEPVRLEIPSIGVDANVVGLSLGNGDPEVPEAWEDAGWYETTRNPGEIGPAVIAGHIDSKAGPAVFYRLRELSPGDEIIVHGSDGDTRSFTVRDSGQYPKTDLPDEVFGFGGAQPELRLITCGGSFDSSVGHYVDNLVVYANAPLGT